MEGGVGAEGLPLAGGLVLFFLLAFYHGDWLRGGDGGEGVWSMMLSLLC